MGDPNRRDNGSQTSLGGLAIAISIDQYEVVAGLTLLKNLGDVDGNKTWGNL